MSRDIMLVAGSGCCLLACAAATGLLLDRSHRSARKLADRIDTVLLPYRPSDLRAGADARRSRLRPSSALHHAVGFRPAHAWRYKLSLRHVLVLSAALAAFVALLTSHMIGPLGDLAAVPAWLLGARLYFRRADRQHAAKLFAQFPDALGMIVRAVRVGVPVGNAIALVGREAAMPTRWEFREVAEAVAIGRPLNEALVRMAERSAVTEYRFFATALALQARAGGSLTETLDTLADTIRKRVAARQRGHALASEARTSCYIIAALPFVVGAGLSLISPSYMAVMLTTTTGNRLLALAAASLCTGLFVMNWITKQTLR